MNRVETRRRRLSYIKRVEKAAKVDKTGQGQVKNIGLLAELLLTKGSLHLILVRLLDLAAVDLLCCCDETLDVVSY